MGAQVGRNTQTREARRPWLLQIAVPAMVTSLVSGTGGYLFGDSAAEKKQAEIRAEVEKSRAVIRADVIKQYFAVDNQMAGKRKQMLEFILATIAKDDSDLSGWARREMQVVDKHLAELDTERTRLQKAIESKVIEVTTGEAAKKRLDQLADFGGRE